MSPFESTTKGRLLLATPPLEDPNFDRTVIYMLEHNSDGAVGVVLNRPGSETSVDGLDDWVDRLSPPYVLFSGGPVETDALIALGRADSPNEEAWSPIVGDLGTLDLNLDPEQVAARMRQLRIFRGYAGWGEFQLDSELSAGAWMVLPADVDDMFTPRPEQLWRDVLRRQGGRLAWIANAPDDLSAN
jgi:putative transcriptional regulator